MTEKRNDYDVVVIGGGPSGSTAAALLAERGHQVLVCEREAFPRFHVGESLLPYGVPVLQRLGVWPALLEHGFQRKYGAEFVFEPAGDRVRLDFTRSLDADRSMALQVRRADFDQILLANAEARGAEVRQACGVEEVLMASDRAVGVRLAESGEEVHARVVIDATGRDTLLGKQLRLKRRDDVLRQAAIFSHFEGAEMGLGHEGGDILIVGGPYGWFWMIPLDTQTASVGVVFPSRVIKECQGDTRKAFEQLIASSPEVAGRLSEARQLRNVEAVADFSYRCDRFTGHGFAMVGDAAGFLDPVFSSGVMLAMRTAERAADRISWVLQRREQVDQHDLASYERFARRGLNRFRRYILAFYDAGGVRTFSEQPPKFLSRAAVSAFGGKVFERDPRIWAFERLFSLNSARWHRLGQRGEAALPVPPAHA